MDELICVARLFLPPATEFNWVERRFLCTVAWRYSRRSYGRRRSAIPTLICHIQDAISFPPYSRIIRFELRIGFHAVFGNIQTVILIFIRGPQPDRAFDDREHHE